MNYAKAWIVIIIFGGLSLGLYTIKPLAKVAIDFFSSDYSVTINNQSDYEIVSVESGTQTLTESGDVIDEPQDMYEKPIKPGAKVTIKPDLSNTEEKGIYIKYVDSTGNTSTESLCGYYTWNLELDAQVMINNNGAIVEQECTSS